MPREILLALISASIPALASVIVALITNGRKEQSSNSSIALPPNVKLSTPANRKRVLLITGTGIILFAIIGYLIGVITSPSKNVCEQIKLTASPDTLAIKQSVTTPEWKNINYQFTASSGVNAQILMFRSELFVDLSSQKIPLASSSSTNYSGNAILGDKETNIADGISAEPSFVKTAQSNGIDHYIDRKIFYVIIPSQNIYCELIADVKVKSIP